MAHRMQLKKNTKKIKNKSIKKRKIAQRSDTEKK